MNGERIRYRLTSVILKRFFWAKDLRRYFRLICRWLGSFTRNSTHMGRRASQLHFQSDTSREMLRAKKALQDYSFYQSRHETLCGSDGLGLLAVGSFVCAML